jgi:hypothetical protein
MFPDVETNGVGRKYASCHIVRAKFVAYAPSGAACAPSHTVAEWAGVGWCYGITEGAITSMAQEHVHAPNNQDTKELLVLSCASALNLSERSAASSPCRWTPSC